MEVNLSTTVLNWAQALIADTITLLPGFGRSQMETILGLLLCWNPRNLFHSLHYLPSRVSKKPPSPHSLFSCNNTDLVNLSCVGTAKDETSSFDSSDSKPKQLKFPNQVYIDLPLWKDEQSDGPGVGIGGGAESQEEPATSTSSTSTTPQHTPTNSLKRAGGRRRTDTVLYGCASLLAAVALGLDLRDAHKATPTDEVEPREDRKKREGLFQRATRFRRSSSPRRDDNLLAMSSISECNSTKCLLHSDSEGPEHSSVTEAPLNGSGFYNISQSGRNVGRTNNLCPPLLAEHGTTSVSRLRRKKSSPAVCQNGE